MEETTTRRRIGVPILLQTAGLLALWLGWVALTVGPLLRSAPNWGPIQDHFARGSYYLLWGVPLFWLYAARPAWKNHGQRLVALVRSDLVGVLFVTLITAAVCATVPAMFRVLADETNIVALSKSMTFEQRVLNNTEGAWYYDQFVPAPGSDQMDKRHLLLPFVAHGVHLATGYRPENLFVVNLAFLWGLFQILYFACKHVLGGRIWGLTVVLLTASQPLVTLGARSAGLEIAHATLLVVVLLVAYYFLRSPSSERLLFLWATTILFLHSRYEAIAASAVILGLLAAFARQRWALLVPHLRLYAMSTLLLLPILWQRIIKFTDPEQPERTLAAAFGWRSLAANSRQFLSSLATGGAALPMARAVCWAGLAGLALFVIELRSRSILDPARNSSNKAARQAAWITLATLAVSWIIVTSYHAGRVDQPASARLFMVFVLALTLGATWFLRRFPPTANRPTLVLALAVVALAVYHPVAMAARFAKSQIIIREYRMVLEFAKAQPDRNFLVIYDRPNMLTVYDFGAISFGRVKRTPEAYLQQRDNHLFRSIFAVQKVQYGEPPTVRPEHALPSTYSLEPIAEEQISAQEFLRISRVK
jgi:uncharacterized membrane protein